MKRSVHVALALGLGLMFTVSLCKLAICLLRDSPLGGDPATERGGEEDVNLWLEANGLGQHKALFKQHGEFFGCPTENSNNSRE